MKGKAAAQNANRRTKEALDRVTELEAKVAELHENYRIEVNALRAERDQARSRLITEVGTLAAAAVSEANTIAMATVQRMRKECHDQILAGFRWMSVHALEGRIPSDLEGCAKAFGVEVGQLIISVDQGEFDRRGRRMSNKKFRDLAAFHRDVERSGRPPLDASHGRLPSGGGFG